MKRILSGALVPVALALFTSQAQAQAQAPRSTAKAGLKYTDISMEFGQPPWNDDRLAAMEQQIPVGAAWRTGADGVTTLTVEGDSCFLGNQLIEPGVYGVNVLHTGEKAWNFVLFEQPSAMGPQYRGVRASVEIQAKCKFDATPVTESLEFSFPKVDRTQFLTLAFGPIRVMAPISDVKEKASDVVLNGETVTVHSYIRPSGLDMSRPVLAGYMNFELGGEDCNMRYYVTFADGQATTLFVNADREKHEQVMAKAAEAISKMQSAGAGNAQVDAAISQMERRAMKAEMMLEDLTAMPHNLKYTSSISEAANPGSLIAKLNRKGDSLVLDVQAGTQKASIQINEKDFKAGDA